MANTAVYRHPTAKPAKPNPPITPRDRLAAIQCNQWLRPNEHAAIRQLLASDTNDEDLEHLHREMRRRLNERGRAA